MQAQCSTLYQHMLKQLTVSEQLSAGVETKAYNFKKVSTSIPQVAAIIRNNILVLAFSHHLNFLLYHLEVIACSITNVTVIQLPNENVLPKWQKTY